MSNPFKGWKWYDFIPQFQNLFKPIKPTVLIPNSRTNLINPAIVEERYSEIRIWDNVSRRPVFGWAPILFGWHVAVKDDPTYPAGRRIEINGLPWDPSIVIPYKPSPYSDAAKFFCKPEPVNEEE